MGDVVNLFDAAAEARETGMAKSAETSGEEWALYARRFVKEFLETHDSLHVDDLWAAGLEEPVSARGLGQVVKDAIRSGWMVRWPAYDSQMNEVGVVARPSVSSNLSLKPVWKSKLYGR